MSDVPGGGAGGEGASAPQEILTEEHATAVFEGLLDPPKRERRQPPPPAAQEAEAEPNLGEAPDVEPATEPPIDDDEEEQPEPDDSEESDEPAHQIDPPTAWSVEDKAVFQSLPPAAQEVISRRERERDTAFRRKTEEVSETRRALESTLTETQSERSNYARNLEQLLFVAAPEAEKFASINWQQLAQTDPAEYVRLTAERDALRGRIGGIQGELQRVQALAQQDQAQQFASLRQQEAQKLVEAIPDFADAEKGPAKAAAMRQWLQKKGFSDTEISQVIDHRVLLVVDEAMRADRVQQARKQAETKRQSPAPTSQPPGASRQRPDSAAARQRAQKFERLRQSGSEGDAISLFMDILR